MQILIKIIGHTINLGKSVQGIYLFEIKKIRRITSFSGNELATTIRSEYKLLSIN